MYNSRRHDSDDVDTYIHDFSLNTCDALFATFDQDLVDLQILTGLAGVSMLIRITGEGNLDRILILQIYDI